MWTLDTYLPVRPSLCADLALGEVWCWCSLYELPLPLLRIPVLWGCSIYHAVQTVNLRFQGEFCSFVGIPRRACLGRGGLELSIRTVLGTRTDHSAVFFKWAELQMSSDKKQWPAGFPQREVRLEKKETPKGVLYRKLKIKKKYYLLLFYGRTGVHFSKAESLRIKCLWDIKCNSGREWWGLWQMYHRQVFMKGAPTTQIQPIAQRRKMSLNVFSLLKIVMKSQKFRYLYNFLHM